MVDINFPIVEINPTQSYIGVAWNHDEHTKCYESALKTGFFGDLYVIDVQGWLYKVAGVRKIENIGRFGGWTWSLQRWTRIKLEYSEGSHISLTEAKSFLLSVIDRDPEFWEESGDLIKIKSVITGASNHRELIDLFTTRLK